MSFPLERPRRLRQSAALRSMVRETHLRAEDLIYPVFVTEGERVRREIPSMPGQFNLSIDELLRDLQDVVRLGIPAIILFGLPAHKDAGGSSAFDEHGIVQRAVRAVKQEYPDLLAITDVCLCEYTDHGHCGILHGNKVANDETLLILGRVALSHARAGADMVAPSDMMDGRIAAIRSALDADGYSGVPIMAYSVKYASAFYGPFREAAQSAPQFGDRRGYQMDPANAREALREARLDLAEGADIIMVKPALAYLDIIRALRPEIDVPMAAYNVSGEYAMVKAAARAGWIDERSVVLESLTGMKRAGADLILTYHARDVARWLRV